MAKCNKSLAPKTEPRVVMGVRVPSRAAGKAGPPNAAAVGVARHFMQRMASLCARYEDTDTDAAQLGAMLAEWLAADAARRSAVGAKRRAHAKPRLYSYTLTELGVGAAKPRQFSTLAAAAAAWGVKPSSLLVMLAQRRHGANTCQRTTTDKHGALLVQTMQRTRLENGTDLASVQNRNKT